MEKQESYISVNTDGLLQGNVKVSNARFFFNGGLREMCIKYGYYDCGDCDDYAELLTFYNENVPTIDIIYQIADNIVLHTSNEKFIDCEEYIDDIPYTGAIVHVMYQIEHECVYSGFCIEDRD